MTTITSLSDLATLVAASAPSVVKPQASAKPAPRRPTAPKAPRRTAPTAAPMEKAVEEPAFEWVAVRPPKQTLERLLVALDAASVAAGYAGMGQLTELLANSLATSPRDAGPITPKRAVRALRRLLAGTGDDVTGASLIARPRVIRGWLTQLTGVSADGARWRAAQRGEGPPSTLVEWSAESRAKPATVADVLRAVSGASIEQIGVLADYLIVWDEATVSPLVAIANDVVRLGIRACAPDLGLFLAVTLLWISAGNGGWPADPAELGVSGIDRLLKAIDHVRQQAANPVIAAFVTGNVELAASIRADERLHRDVISDLNRVSGEMIADWDELGALLGDARGRAVEAAAIRAVSASAAVSTVTPAEAVAAAMAESDIEVDVAVPTFVIDSLPVLQIQRRAVPDDLTGPRECVVYPGVVWEAVGVVSHALDLDRSDASARVVIIAPRRVGRSGLDMNDCRFIPVDDYNDYYGVVAQ